MRQGNNSVIEGGDIGGENRMKRTEFENIENNSSLQTFARARFNRSVAFDETPLRKSVPELSLNKVKLDTSIMSSEGKSLDLRGSLRVELNK